ncbi:hypothetical protein [Aurantiacibacter poecillastricola]|uniref:hypothetical protein n=1 Tax=Aurantiacibacter poecillastricola TaxID=3064385 RepID=UPI00273DB0AD|nr:hypothetical protein [Aurantiacibacter sp. 219JJ12-13]MDP5262601.1 hypothetical protein [Aurantiacibacter sp. 219JJ12-13]
MTRIIAALAALSALAACGEEPTPEATAAEVVAPEPVASAPAPDEDLFAQLHAETCPDAEPVSTSICQRAMGAETASCEFGLGDDDVLRNDATLELDETGEAWVIADAETVCAL